MKASSVKLAVSSVVRELFRRPILSGRQRFQSSLLENLEARINFGYGWNNGPQTPNPIPPYTPPGTCPPPSPLPAGGTPGLPGGGSPGGGNGPRPSPRPASPAGNTAYPINYFTGTPQYASTDLLSDAFGVPWGHVRSWTGLNEGGINGNGWMTSDLPYLVVKMNQYASGHGGILSVVQGGGSGYEFTIDVDATDYKPRYGSTESIKYVPGYQSGSTYVPGTFEFKDSNGNTTTFYDVPRDSTTGFGGNATITDANGNKYSRMSQNGGGYAQGVTRQWFDPTTGAESDVATPYRFGTFKSWTDASGKVTSTANYDSNGNLTDVVRTDGSGLYERFHYDNNTNFTNNLGGVATVLTKVTLQRSTNLAGPWTDIRSAEYTYYTGSSTAADRNYGRFGDLKLVVIKDYQKNSSGDVVDQKYYRYDKFGSSSHYSGDSVNGPTNLVSTTGGPDDWDGSSTPTNSFYRSGDVAVMSGLKSVFEGTHFARLAANLGGVSSFDSLPDSSVNPYASNVFAYQRIDPGSAEYPAYNGQNTIYRATSEIVAGEGCSTCSGGFGTYTLDYHVGRQWNTYAYDSSSGWTNNFDTNTWYIRTTETMPDQTASVDDNDRNIVYTNEIGEPILMVQVDRNGTDSTTDDKQYLTYYRYDAQGRLVLVAHPSVFQQSGGTSYNESYTDLINWSGSSEYVRQNAGLIDVYAYGTTTTATATVAGDALGYLKSMGVQQGFAGTVVSVMAQAYFTHTYGGSTVYPVAATTDYRDVNGDNTDDAIVTTVSYTWALDGSSNQTNRIASRTVTYPAVSTSRNGSGIATTEATVFDTVGRPVWNKDQSGFITYTQYDTATGAVSKRIVDVDTTKTSDFSNLPSGWTTPSGGGLHLITTGQFEALGRPVMVTDPNGDVTYTVYNDANHETRTYHSAAGTFSQVGPVFINRTYWPAQGAAAGQRQVFTESITANVTPSLTGGVPDGTETIASSNIQALARSLTNDAGQTIEKDTYTNLDSVTYSALTASFGTAGVNYLATLLAYDDRGRKKRIETPDGTITRTLYDARGVVLSTWKGTDDTTSTGYWSPSNQGGANLVKIASNTYDADKNLMTSNRVLAHDTTTGADTSVYQTNYGYDYRDRLTDVRTPNKVATKYTLDNGGNQIVTQTYADANSNFAIDSGELRGKRSASYDDRDQVYRSTAFEVAPSTGSTPGAVGDALTTNYWYDPRGNQVKTRTANGLMNKTLFDGANRQTATYTTTDSTESSYADALSATNDHVIEQTGTFYDRGGRDVLDVSFKRKNDSPTTGLLTSENSWSQSSANWYDAADRLVETANYGSEYRGDYDGSGNAISPAPTRQVFNRSTGTLIDADGDKIPDVAEGTPPAPPTAANETDYGYIVTQYGYDAGGRLYRTIDNKNRITNTAFDLAGRKLSVIENYQNGVIVPAKVSSDRLTRYVYDNDGRLAQIVATNTNGSTLNYQTTSFLYTSPIDQSWVTKTVYPDSTATTAATAKSVTALTQSNGLATATSTSHGYAVGDTVSIDGVTNDGRYNGWVTVTSVTANTFTFVVPPELATTASGTITARKLTGSDLVATTFDRLGRKATETDQRGVTHTYTYDTAGRLSSDSVGTGTLPTGVDGTVRTITYGYDDLSRQNVTSTYGNGGVKLTQVDLTYDGWGNVIKSQQNHSVAGGGTAPSVLYSYTDGATGGVAKYVRLDTMTYPNGRVVQFNYSTAGSDSDALNRVDIIHDNTGSGTDLVDYNYVGAYDSAGEEKHPGVSGGLTLTFGLAGNKMLGWDRFGRTIHQQWRNDAGNTELDRLDYTYDRAGNRLTTDRNVGNTTADDGYSESFEYDGLDRLIDYRRGTQVSGTVPKSPTSTSLSFRQTWGTLDSGGNVTTVGLDALGNWTKFVQDSDGGGSTAAVTQNRTVNAANELQSVTGNSPAWTTPAYDTAGNMTTTPKGQGNEATPVYFVYDGWNRVAGISSTATPDGDFTDAGEVLYKYDGLGRRVGKVFASGSAFANEDTYYSEGYQALETRRNGSTNAYEQFMWDQRYVDAPVVRYRDADGSSAHGLEETRYTTYDANYDVTGLVQPNQTFVERYVYTPYGDRTVLTGTFGARSGTSYDFWRGHQGLRQDAESLTYDNRARQYSSDLGVFAGREPAGARYIDTNNLYQVAKGAPVRMVDPSGNKSGSYGGGSVAVGGADAVGPWDAWQAGGRLGPFMGADREAAEKFGREMAKKWACNPYDRNDPERANLEEAARHAYWQARLTSEHGQEAANTIGNLHELDTDSKWTADSERDMKNNQAGQQIGQRGYTDEQIKEAVEAALISGRLWGLDPDDPQHRPYKLPRLKPCPRRSRCINEGMPYPDFESNSNQDASSNSDSNSSS